MPFYSFPFYSIPFHSVLFHSVPFDSLLFYSILFSSIPFCSGLCPSTAGSSPQPESSSFLCPLLSLSILLPHNVISPTTFWFPTDLTPFYLPLCAIILLLFLVRQMKTPVSSMKVAVHRRSPSYRQACELRDLGLARFPFSVARRGAGLQQMFSCLTASAVWPMRSLGYR